jgi:hypothetical protein
LLSFVTKINPAWRCVFAVLSMATFAISGLLIWNVELPVALSTDEISYVKVFKTWEMQNGQWVSYAASVFALISFLVNLFSYFSEQKMPRWHETSKRINQRLNRT